MIIKKEFIKNYLTNPHYKNGITTSFFLLSLCLIFSLFYWDASQDIYKYLSANYNNVFGKNEYWRLLTTTLVHANLKHLLSNSLMLYILTYFVTSFYGSFISIFVSLLASMITNGIVLTIYRGDITLVGASGVVYYLWGFWLILYMLLQRHLSLTRRILQVGTVFLVLLIPTEFSPSTSYLAHYVGFLIGIFFGLIYYILKRKTLLASEKWKITYESDALSELDEIALNYDKE